MNKKKMLSTVLVGMIFLSVAVAIIPTASAKGPKSIYGYVYINDEPADAGTKVKIEIDGDIYNDLTDGSGWYDIGLPSGYEGKIGYFKVTNKNIVPDDNKSVLIGSETGYFIDLHVTKTSSGDDDDDSGGGGGGGAPPAGPTNMPPVANASASETFGLIGESINFNGSLSTDSDGIITRYAWNFDDGATGNGKTTTYTYSSSGTYHVALTITDDGGATDEDTIDVIISVANNPPTKPAVNGPSTGNKNTAYDYTAVSTDADNDTIRYTFDWDDGSANTVTDFLSSGTATTQTHNWAAPGIYEISVKAYDNETDSAATKLTVLIDVHWVKDIGYLIDDDSDGAYDTFYSNSTKNQTDINKQDDGTYLIDNDGDDNWDYVYDVETDTLTEYNEPTTDDYTLLIIVIIVAILILIIIGYLLKRKKDENEE